jgi:hypothetical protein
VVEPAALQIESLSWLNPREAPDHGGEFKFAWDLKTAYGVAGLVAAVDDALYFAP